ncbi:MAG: DUF4442 domain-containing protein [Saprospiraceae bacterium]
MVYSQFIHRVTHPALFSAYLFRRLPAAWFMGLRVLTCDRQAASVRLRYGWRSRNPFGSIYFAAQCAAGELSTGVLALGAIAETGAPVSMLVTEVKAEFVKKAAETLVFVCADGDGLRRAIREAVEGGEPTVYTARSEGLLPDGTRASEIHVRWSFKRKNKK